MASEYPAVRYRNKGAYKHIVAKYADKLGTEEHAWTFWGPGIREKCANNGVELTIGSVINHCLTDYYFEHHLRPTDRLPLWKRKKREVYIRLLEGLQSLIGNDNAGSTPDYKPGGDTEYQVRKLNQGALVFFVYNVKANRQAILANEYGVPAKNKCFWLVQYIGDGDKIFLEEILEDYNRHPLENELY